jgi:hypothetical protein
MFQHLVPKLVIRPIDKNALLVVKRVYRKRGQIAVIGIPLLVIFLRYY